MLLNILIGIVAWSAVIGIVVAGNLAMHFVHAYFSGWRYLSRHFPVRSFTYRVQLFSVWATINGNGYCVRVEANDEYLTLIQSDHPLAKRMYFHPPFTIPRKAVGQVTFTRGWISRSVTFFVGEDMLTLRGDVVDAEFWH